MRLRSTIWLLVCPALLAQEPVVTATKTVMAEGGRAETVLRKINNRWWSQDNREVSPPPPGGFFWVLDSDPGVVHFLHHRPFQLSRAESLRLWMTPQEVQSTLGQPNRTAGPEKHEFWMYYAADGTKLMLRFMGEEGLLGDAKYESIGGKSWKVASIDRELNGSDIYKLLAERANRRVSEEDARRMEQFHAAHALRTDGLRTRPSVSRTAQPTVVTVEAASGPEPFSAQPAAPARAISAEALAAISPGATREDVLNRLGEPKFRDAITDDEGTRESFRYALDGGGTVVVRLRDGKVAEVVGP